MDNTSMDYTREKIADVADELRRVVDAAAEDLNRVDDDAASDRPAPGKWCFKEIVGHLIDSASNNHQRFVRAPGLDVFTFPGYAQDDWVARQGYRERDWGELIALWRLYNRQIADVVVRIAEPDLRVECRIGSYNPSSLGYLIEDYLTHLKHHLKALPAR